MPKAKTTRGPSGGNVSEWAQVGTIIVAQDKAPEATDAPGVQGDDDREAADAQALAVHPRKNLELFQYLITTFQSMLPPEKGAAFAMVADELIKSVGENCTACQAASHDIVSSQRDPRRSRFLLRLVVGKVSHLFSGPRPMMPRTLIEGLDRYLKKAFGPMIYDELNAEADQLLYRLNCDDDKEMWRLIRENPDWARFVDTVFIRILFRFENFAHGKKIFMTILDTTMQEISKFNFTNDHFSAVFEALFSDLYEHMEMEEQRLRWDFHFGDGTCKRIGGILDQGLVNYLKKRNSRMLGSGRVVATAPAKK